MDFIFDPSLVLYLPLSQLDGASFRSRDVYGHLSAVTGAVWRAGGRYFDGTDDKVDCGSHSSLGITGALTLVVWAYKQKAGLGAVLDMATEGTTSENYAIVHSATDQLMFQWNNGGWQSTIVDGYWVNDKWIYCVVTYNGGAVDIYRNLDIVKSETGKAALVADTDNTLYIARYQVGTKGWFQGIIGEVGIYSRALTPQEIQRNYLATKWRYC